MTIGEVFAKAWELWRRDVGWLILAGLVVGLIVGVIAVVVVVIVTGMAAVSLGGMALGSANDSAGLTGAGLGSLVLAGIVGIIGYLIVSVVALIFYAGMFEMVISAARERRGVQFGELFSGFQKFGQFIVLWLVMAGIGIACGLVFLIPVLGWIAVPVFLAWLGTTWLYVLPLIVDRELTFAGAARASSQLVKGVGWWKTFATIVVLGAAFFVIVLVISFISRQSSGLGTFLTFVFEILAFPFAICYVSTMYLQSGGDADLLPLPGTAAPAVPGPFAPSPYGQVGQPVPPPPLVAPLVTPLAPPPPAPPAVGQAAGPVAVPPPPPSLEKAPLPPPPAPPAAAVPPPPAAAAAASPPVAPATAWAPAADAEATGVTAATAPPPPATAAPPASAPPEDATRVTEAAADAASGAAGEAPTAPAPPEPPAPPGV